MVSLTNKPNTFARIASINYYLPNKVLTNDDLSRQFQDWSSEKIFNKTGINQRHISDENEFSSDLATEAAKKLLADINFANEDIEYLIVCTQSPDFFLPTTACIVHENLGLSNKAAAIDINMGCSGYIYGLGLAKSILESGQAKNVLLITADTYTKFLNSEDRSVKTIFGDGASATLLVCDSPYPTISLPVFGTDGSGAKSLIVPRGGLRNGEQLSPRSGLQSRHLLEEHHDLFMDGPAIFNFTLERVPEVVDDILTKEGSNLNEIDFVVFHQANGFMLEHIRKKMSIPESKFIVSLENSGNTVSSTIPIALKNSIDNGEIKNGMKLLLVGFGVGLSWGGLILEL